MKPAKPKHEDIAVKAYEIWEREGRQENKADEHWLRAERELTGDGNRPAEGPGEAGEDRVTQTSSGTSRRVARARSSSPEAGGSRGGRKARGSGRGGGKRGGSPQS